MKHKRFRARRPRRAAIFFVTLAAFLFALGALLIGEGYVNNRYFDSLNSEIAPTFASPEERVVYTFEHVSRWASFDASRIDQPVRRWLAEFEHASPLHVSARTTLAAGTDRRGPCGALSRTMIVLLHRAGIPARRALLCDDNGHAVHTVVEVWLDGEWRVMDPTYGWMWRRPSDGRIATAGDLRANPELFRSVVVHRANYPLTEYRYANVYHLRWEKVPGLTAVRDLLIRAAGEDWVRSIETPYVYERPTFLIGWFFWVVAVALILLARSVPAPRPAAAPLGSLANSVARAYL